MRIGMMADAYKPKVSGVTSYIELSKRWLEKAGHEVFVFTFGEPDYHDDEANIIRSPGVPLVDTGFYLSLRYNRTARQLLYTMDILHVHHPFISGSLALTYGIPRNIPIIFTNHSRYDLLTNAYLPILPDSFGETAMRAYLPPFCQACDLVVAPSASMRTILQEFGVDVPVEVIPNGVELEAILTCSSLVNRQEFGFSHQDVVLTYVGRLAPEKNLPLLLRAFRGVASAYDHARLLLVGDGPEKERLKILAENLKLKNLIFLNPEPRENMRKIITSFDTSVVPLKKLDIFKGAIPSKIFEALASKKPILLGVEGEAQDLFISEGKCGLSFVPENSDDLVIKIMELYNAPSQAKKLGLNGFNYISKNFNNDLIANEFWNLLNSNEIKLK